MGGGGKGRLPASSAGTTSTTYNTDVVLQKLIHASIVCLIFVSIEVIGGLMSGSLAVLSDAAHLFTDFASFLIAILAQKLAVLPKTQRYTFGLQRMESLAALFSVIKSAM